MDWAAVMACWVSALVAGIFLGAFLGVLIMSIVTMGD
jgi:hypothetical protein